MPTVEVWIVMDEFGNHEVATDEVVAIDRWKDEFGEDFDGVAASRVVRLNVTMSTPLDAGDQTDEAVEVLVPDHAGHTVQVETE